MNLAATRCLRQESRTLLFLKKKKQKDFAHWGSRRAGGSGEQWAKVLWFFLSRKNSLLSQGGEQYRGWQVHNRLWTQSAQIVLEGVPDLPFPREGKNLLLKKKQKDFAHRGPGAQAAPQPSEQEFLGSCFKKRTCYLLEALHAIGTCRPTIVSGWRATRLTPPGRLPVPTPSLARRS